ncbi:hypothetical protein F5Y03DRAFT_247099 [Xylaria venustula]|nr:hypothetical protein F5Y03DRAFT_247099 [Xylaria venustula]
MRSIVHLTVVGIGSLVARLLPPCRPLLPRHNPLRDTEAVEGTIFYNYYVSEAYAFPTEIGCRTVNGKQLSPSFIGRVRQEAKRWRYKTTS